VRTSIEITGLQTYAYHGLFDEEQRLGQKFSFDIAASIAVIGSHNADDLAGSVRYDAVADFAAELSTARKFRTLEALGEAMALGLLEAFPALENVSIGVRKSSPPIAHHLESAGVRISISRSELK
jgi:dihydroneopterin aldolase